MLEGNESVVRQASLSQYEQIVSFDESVIGSRDRGKKIHQAIENGLCCIVSVGKDIAAFGILNHHFFDNYFIELLIVGYKYRRKGFGKMLLEAFKKLYHAKKLFTSTNNSNIPMQMLLEVCGFERCGWIDRLDEGDPEIVYCFRSKSFTL